ncbi:MAG: chromosome partitioning protein ParA [Pseudomonadota bacterium]|nr:chromosome partitioning protein ParA [Pseudomonadota bacterium]
MAELSAPAVRSHPRLWVETLWILDSLAAEQPLREIPLTLGLNLILSPPVRGSTGHGVGKTAFCQLLRFVLDDPQWAAGSPLRDELLQAMPDGAVAAKVHVGGQAWTVVKPWRHQKHYRAAVGASWKQLARDEVPNEHDRYAASLRDSLAGILPVQRLPGSNQPIQWQHVLAWCSRDQGSRYQSYYHWRTEGTGFTLPAQSPALVVRIALGLLTDASTLDQLRKAEDKLRSAEQDLTAWSRRPDDLMAHVKHQLATILGANEASPFRAKSLFDDSSLLALAKQRATGYEQAMQEARDDQTRLESRRSELLGERAPLAQQVGQRKNYVARLEAAIEGNTKEIDRLRNEPQSLESMSVQLCGPGNIPFGECSRVQEQIRTVQFDNRLSENQRAKEKAAMQASLAAQRTLLQPAERALSSVDEQLGKVADALESAKDRELAARADKRRLDEAIVDFEFYEGVVSGKTDWPELSGRQTTVRVLQEEVDRLRGKAEQERQIYAQRRSAINATMEALAKQLPSFTWGVFDDSKPHPFHLGPMHSTTFGVLETLAGDLACLLDSSNPDCYHPGFLLHDSPREAEMSEPVFWALLAAAPQSASAPCQYVVTTSTEAPEQFQSYVRLSLDARSDSGLLFKARIGSESRPLPI